GATREVRVKLSLRDLASGTGIALPAVTSEVRADFDARGGATFSMPARLDFGTRSADMVFSGTVAPGPAGRFVDGTLSGTQLLPADLAAVAFLLGGSPGDGAPPSAAPTPTAAAARTAPFWPALHARLALKFESVSLPHAVLRDVRGTLQVDPATLSLSGGTASLGEGGAARLDGQLAFARGSTAPYSFQAGLAIDNVDSAPLFSALDPDRPPVVEGRFDLAARLAGTGATPANLLDKVQGDLKLSSKGGRFRALRTDIVDAIRVSPSKIADAIDTVSALFGKKSENLGTALIESAKDLSEIRYDQMSVVAERGPDLDLRLTELTLIAPEARLAGSGRIAFAEGVPVQDQALSVDIDMGVRGRLGRFMDLVGLLKDGQDELGYAHIYQAIHLGGTLRNVDQSQWRDMLIQAPLRKGGGLFDKLMGK
ncbi:MAG TPA: AsmA-like C-terminal region-containing protein, partial [Opitutaceae bacterium]